MDRSEFKNSTLFILLGAFVAGLIGLWFGQQYFSSGAAATRFQGKVLLYPQPRPLAPFTLKNPDGSDLPSTQFQGRWTAVFFGFSHCPDICPTTLAQLAAVQKQLATRLPAARQPRLLFVSVDPARDLDPKLRTYVDYFSPEILAATVEEPALEAFTRQLGAQYIRQPPDASGAYSVDHSGDLFLLGPDLTRRGLIRPPFDAATLAADLGALVQ